MLADKTICFIGAGNMARSLLGGLLSSGCPATGLRVADPDPAQRQAVRAKTGIAACEENTVAAEGADVIVFAVKPQVMQTAASGLSALVQQNHPLCISIAAGIPVPALQQWLGGSIPIVRAMPNTPALLGKGAAGLYAGSNVSAAQKETAEAILRAVGLVRWVDDERLIDVVTAISGSGPAYFFLLMEVMEKAGIELGLDEQTARLLVAQTALGAAHMAFESGEGVAILRERVTSPGGTTAAALGVMQTAGFAETIHAAVRAARDRSAELAALHGETQ